MLQSICQAISTNITVYNLTNLLFQIISYDIHKYSSYLSQVIIQISIALHLSQPPRLTAAAVHSCSQEPPTDAPAKRSDRKDALPKTMSKTIFKTLSCHAIYCVSCFAICVIRYPRTKTHKPRGCASDVSTISTCFYML